MARNALGGLHCGMLDTADSKAPGGVLIENEELRNEHARGRTDVPSANRTRADARHHAQGGGNSVPNQLNDNRQDTDFNRPANPWNKGGQDPLPTIQCNHHHAVAVVRFSLSDGSTERRQISGGLAESAALSPSAADINRQSYGKKNDE